MCFRIKAAGFIRLLDVGVRRVLLGTQDVFNVRSCNLITIKRFECVATFLEIPAGDSAATNSILTP